MTYLSLWLFWLLANSRVGVCRTLSGVNNPTNPTNPISNSESIWQQNKDRFSGTNNTTSNSSPMANLTDTDDPDDRDNCQGSWYCNHSPLLPWHKRPTRKMCEFAYERYDVNLYYLGLNTRYYESCLAIIDCFPTAELSGYSIQKAFVQIREHGCERCGSHYFTPKGFPLAQCSVTLNYCNDCVDNGKGSPLAAMLSNGSSSGGSGGSSMDSVNQTSLARFKADNATYGGEEPYPPGMADVSSTADVQSSSTSISTSTSTSLPPQAQPSSNGTDGGGRPVDKYLLSLPHPSGIETS